MWKVREIGINSLCESLSSAYRDTENVIVHFDMDVIGGAGPASGDILGDLAEPIGMTDYEVLRIAHEIANAVSRGHVVYLHSARLSCDLQAY